METIVCGSCKKKVSPGTAMFMCPNCGKSKIIRCRNCRQIAAKYTCHSCGFTGPN